MKEVVLTIDYELFLGDKTGTVKECMIEPTEKLSAILEKYNSRMTIFWDILHYYHLVHLEERFAELREDRILIEKQILDLVKKGNDVQLHLHPHWLDAQYENGKWIFKYDRFQLHNLSKENDIEKINTIIGCVGISKKLMENTIRKVKPSYTVKSFRAGGYLIEPFSELKEALAFNRIFIDSSVAPGTYNDNGLFSYNFNNYPHQSSYHFEYNLSKVDYKGKFIELPITTVIIPAFINILFILIRMVKYPNLESKRIGSGSGEINKIEKKSNLHKIVNLFITKQVKQFTTDNNFKEKFYYMYKKIPNDSNMILHPKLLNQHTLELLKLYLEKSRLKFISIQEYLSKHG